METIDFALLLVAIVIGAVFAWGYFQFLKWIVQCHLSLLRKDSYSTTDKRIESAILVDDLHQEEYAKNCPGLITYTYTFDEKRFHRIVVGCSNPIPDNVIAKYFISQYVQQNIACELLLQNSMKAIILDVRFRTEAIPAWCGDNKEDIRQFRNMVEMVYH